MMDLTPEEIENLCRLLASPDFSNVNLGLEMLKRNPKHIKDALAPLVLLTWGLYGYSDEEYEVMAAAGVLLTKHFGSKKKLNEYCAHLEVIETARSGKKMHWRDFYKQLLTFEERLPEYEPYILAHPDYQVHFFYDLADHLERRYKKYELAYQYLKKAIDYGTEDTDIKSSFVDILLNNLFGEGKHLEEIPRYIQLVNDLIYAYPYYEANYHHLLGIVYDLYVLDKDKAKEHYSKAIELDPQHDAAMNNLANIVYKLDGDYEEALRLVKASLEISPKDIHTLDTLGCIYLYGFKDYANAEAAFKKVLKIKKSHHYSVTGLGETYDATKQYDLALEYYEMGLSYRPKSEYKLTKLGDLLLKMNAPEKAKKVFENILKLYPENLHAQEILSKLV